MDVVRASPLETPRHGKIPGVYRPQPRIIMQVLLAQLKHVQDFLLLLLEPHLVLRHKKYDQHPSLWVKFAGSRVEKKLHNWEFKPIIFGSVWMMALIIQWRFDGARPNMDIDWFQWLVRYISSTKKTILFHLGVHSLLIPLETNILLAVLA